MSAYKDYLFLLRPADVIIAQIRSFKDWAATIIGEYPAVNSTAHISIARYVRQKPFMMEPALDIAARKLQQFKAVQLEINGFDFFVHPDDRVTIYAIIQPAYHTEKWFDELNKLLHLKKKITPHITIARTIPVDSFYRLWPYLKAKNYKERFTADKLTILERGTFAPERKWEIHREIAFQPAKLPGTSEAGYSLRNSP